MAGGLPSASGGARRLALGVDLGGTRLRAAVVGEEGEILRARRWLRRRDRGRCRRGTDLVVIGGGRSNGFDLLLPGIRAHIHRYALGPFRDVPLARAALGDNSGLIGAAATAFARSPRPG